MTTAATSPGAAGTAVAGLGVGTGVWSDLVGQERVVEVLAQAVASPAGMTHAWLFTGPPGSGRSTAARAFAAALQCLRGGAASAPPAAPRSVARTPTSRW